MDRTLNLPLAYGGAPFLLAATVLLSACVTASSPDATAPLSAEPSVMAAGPAGRTSSAAAETVRPAAPRRASNLPSSIDSSGSKDVTAALQSVINQAPNGSTIVFKAGGTYRLGSALYVRGKKGLTLDGNGATLKLDGTGLIIEQLSADTTVRDLAFVGDHAAAGTADSFVESDHAISVYGSTNTIIENVDIRRVRGDCLYISAHQGIVWADGVTLRDSTCRLNGRMGVTIIAGSNVRVVRNTFDEIAYSVVGIEPNTGKEGARGVVMKDNTVGTYSLTNQWKGKLFYAENAPWSTGATVKDVTISGNTVAGNRGGYDGEMMGLQIKATEDTAGANYTITGNTAAKSVAGPVILIWGVNGVTISGNKQPLASGKLTSLSGSTNVTSENNDA